MNARRLTYLLREICTLERPAPLAELARRATDILSSPPPLPRVHDCFICAHRT
jgi:hypothetical protein